MPTIASSPANSLVAVSQAAPNATINLRKQTTTLHDGGRNIPIQLENLDLTNAKTPLLRYRLIARDSNGSLVDWGVQTLPLKTPTGLSPHFLTSIGSGNLRLSLMAGEDDQQFIAAANKRLGLIVGGGQCSSGEVTEEKQRIAESKRWANSVLQWANNNNNVEPANAQNAIDRIVACFSLKNREDQYFASSQYQARCMHDPSAAHEMASERRSSILDLSKCGIKRLDLKIFEELRHVKNLDLSQNQLQGLPEGFDMLTNLIGLDLRFNQLESLPQNFHKLSQLKRLFLCNNNFSKCPAAIFEITNLEQLFMGRNKLESVPTALDNLRQLGTLVLNDNLLKSLPPQICNLIRLEWLCVSNNQLTALPNNLGSLTNLRELALDHNRIGALPMSFCNLKLLVALNLEYNRLVDLPARFGDLSSLKRLCVSHNPLVCLPESFGKLAELTHLYLIENRCKKLPDFQHLENIECLYLTDDQHGKLPNNFQRS